MKLSETFPKEVVTVKPEASLFEVVTKMRDENVGAVVVTQDNKVVGIVTDRDIALKTVLGDAKTSSPVSEVMTTKVRTIWDDQGIFNATQYFRNHGIRRLPIIERGDTVVGMVTADDLFGLFSRELFNIAHALEPSLGEDV
jgi:CBS domain-containing protein